MGKPAARRVGPAWVDGAIAFLDHGDLSVHVHHKGCAIGNSHSLNQHAILLGDLTVMIADQRELRCEFFGPMGESRYKICADRQHLRIVCSKFSDTSLVCSEFLRSTTGEGGGEEGQDDVLLTLKIGKLNILAAGVGAGGNGEIGRRIAHFQSGLRWRRVLRQQREAECGKRQESEILHISLGTAVFNGAYHGHAAAASHTIIRTGCLGDS